MNMGMAFQHPSVATTISSASIVPPRRQRSADETSTSGGGTIPRPVRRSVLQSVSDDGTFDGTYSWIVCHQLILSALQGVALLAEQRTKVANSISDMIRNQKSMVIDFVKNEIIPHAMENNACKALECSKKELGRALTNERIDRLSKLWDSFYISILPNIQSMLYPLEQFDNAFNCRKYVLSAFRDRALIPVMREWKTMDSRLTQMLVVVAIGTQDKSKNYDQFLSICSNCLPGFTVERREDSLNKSSTTYDEQAPSHSLKREKSRRAIPDLNLLNSFSNLKLRRRGR